MWRVDYIVDLYKRNVLCKCGHSNNVHDYTTWPSYMEESGYGYCSVQKCTCNNFILIKNLEFIELVNRALQ